MSSFLQRGPDGLHGIGQTPLGDDDSAVGLHLLGGDCHGALPGRLGRMHSVQYGGAPKTVAGVGQCYPSHPGASSTDSLKSNCHTACTTPPDGGWGWTATLAPAAGAKLVAMTLILSHKKIDTTLGYDHVHNGTLLAEIGSSKLKGKHFVSRYNLSSLRP